MSRWVVFPALVSPLTVAIRRDDGIETAWPSALAVPPRPPGSGMDYSGRFHPLAHTRGGNTLLAVGCVRLAFLGSRSERTLCDLSRTLLRRRARERKSRKEMVCSACTFRWYRCRGDTSTRHSYTHTGDSRPTRLSLYCFFSTVLHPFVLVDFRPSSCVRTCWLILDFRTAHENASFVI